MTQPAPSGPLAQSFAEHLRAFHAGSSWSSSRRQLKRGLTPKAFSTRGARTRPSAAVSWAGRTSASWPSRSCACVA